MVTLGTKLNTLIRGVESNSRYPGTVKGKADFVEFITELNKTPQINPDVTKDLDRLKDKLKAIDEQNKLLKQGEQNEFLKQIDTVCKKKFADSSKKVLRGPVVPCISASVPAQAAVPVPSITQATPTLSKAKPPIVSEQDAKVNVERPDNPCVMHLPLDQVPNTNPYVTGMYSSLTTLFSQTSQANIEEIYRTKQEKVEALCKVAQEGNLEDLAGDDYPLWALAAFKYQRLSIDDFCVITMHWCISKHHGDQFNIVDLFPPAGSEVETDLKKMLLYSMMLSPEPCPDHKRDVENFIEGRVLDSKFYQQYPNCLTQDEFNEFFLKLRGLSPLQKKFWLITAQPGDPDQIPVSHIKFNDEDFKTPAAERSVSIITSLIKQSKMSTFYDIESAKPEEPRDCKSVPNLSMVGAYLSIKTKQHIRFKPMIGQVSPATVMTQCEAWSRESVDTCLVSLAFPKLVKFETVNGFKIHFDYDLTYYDSMGRGHALLAIPLAQRKLRIKIAQHLQSHVNPSKQKIKEKKIKEIFSRVLVEMRLPDPNAKNPLNNIFRQCVNESVLQQLCSSPQGPTEGKIAKTIKKNEQLFVDFINQVKVALRDKMKEGEDKETADFDEFFSHPID